MPRRTELPHMTLCNGCGACCGPVTARRDEVKRIRKFMKENDVEWLSKPVEDGTIDFACGFLRPQDDGSLQCAIHSVRPWTCRAFGVIEEMPCPLFPEAAVMSIPRKQAQLLRLIDPEDEYLGESFEEGYLRRIGGRGIGVALHAMATVEMQKQRAREHSDESDPESAASKGRSATLAPRK